MGAAAAGHPRLHKKPRRNRKRPFGIRHRHEYLRRWSSGRRSTLFARCKRGFSGNSQCAPWSRQRIAAFFPCYAGQSCVDHPFERISPGWLEICAAPEHNCKSHPQRPAKESCFYDVKIFSHPSGTPDLSQGNPLNDSSDGAWHC